MRYKIEKIEDVKMRNINGEPIETAIYYLICRVRWFGLKKEYIRIANESTWHLSYAVSTYVVPKNYASRISDKGDAQLLLDAIRTNPDKFVLAN